MITSGTQTRGSRSDGGRGRTARAMCLALALPAAACGGKDDDPVGPGGGPGNASVLLLDEVPPRAEEGAAPVLRGQVIVELSTDGETWVPLSGPLEVELGLQAGDSAIVADDPAVPSGLYERIRIVLIDATVVLEEGTTFDGETLNAPLVMRLDSGEEGILKTVAGFPLGGAVPARLVLELNSYAWITPDNVAEGVVGDAQLQAAMQVHVRTGEDAG